MLLQFTKRFSLQAYSVKEKEAGKKSLKSEKTHSIRYQNNLNIIRFILGGFTLFSPDIKFLPSHATLTLLNQHMYPHSYLERHMVNQSEDLHL